MLSREENELLTWTGPATPAGDYSRRYWLPALLASEVPAPDCPPVRLRILGEDLVAFRDTEGRVGLIDEFCPHRRASLFCYYAAAGYRPGQQRSVTWRHAFQRVRDKLFHAIVGAFQDPPQSLIDLNSSAARRLDSTPQETHAISRHRAPKIPRHARPHISM